MLYAWLMVASLWGGLASPLGLQPAPDWVLEDEDVPPPARRITPKSVFVAPTFAHECGPGYRHDPALGRCVRIVKVNQKAQWDFFLSRLNAMYAQPTKQKVQSGPLHLALPLDPVTSTASTPPTTTSTPPTTVTETTVPSTTTTEEIPSTTTTATTELLSTTTSVPDTTTYPSTQEDPAKISTTESTTTTTDLPPSTLSSVLPTDLPSTYFTQETTFPFSSTYPDTTTFSSFPETTESFTEYQTFSEPITVPSEPQHVTLKSKRRCPPSVRQIGDYGSDYLDCEDTPRPQVRFPSRRKGGYVRFPDRTWQSSYWWPHTWEPSHSRVPLPSSYQKIQHYPSWQRGRPAWLDAPLAL